MKKYKFYTGDYWCRYRFMGLAIGAIVCMCVIALSCNSSKINVAPLPCEGSQRDARCGVSCTAGGSECGSEFYCGTNYTCTAECTVGGNQCESGRYCKNGRCVVDDGIDGGNQCGNVDVALSPVVPRVMLLIDQSGSMTDNSFGKINGKTVNRWEAVRYALVDEQVGVVTQLQDRVKFAATLYHSIGGNKEGHSCPLLTQSNGTPLGAPMLNNAPAIATLFDDNDPERDTPTAESVRDTIAAMGKWTSGPDLVDGPRVLLLATDGDPDNCVDPDAHNQSSQQAVEAEVVKAYGLGVQTYVLSVGSEPSESHLEKVANAGVGKPLTPPDAPFFRGNDPEQLIAAFDQIIRGVRTCDFAIKGTVDMDRQSEGTVVLDGKKLVWNTDWQLVNESTLKLLGDDCDTFLNADQVALSATFPCGTVIPIE